MGLRSVYLAVLLDKMGAMMVLPLLPFLARSKLASIGTFYMKNCFRPHRQCRSPRCNQTFPASMLLAYDFLRMHGSPLAVGLLQSLYSLMQAFHKFLR